MKKQIDKYKKVKKFKELVSVCSLILHSSKDNNYFVMCAEFNRFLGEFLSLLETGGLSFKEGYDFLSFVKEAFEDDFSWLEKLLFEKTFDVEEVEVFIHVEFNSFFNRVTVECLEVLGRDVSDFITEEFERCEGMVNCSSKESEEIIETLKSWDCNGLFRCCFKISYDRENTTFTHQFHSPTKINVKCKEIRSDKGVTK
jgi:hypothetical protein